MQASSNGPEIPDPKGPGISLEWHCSECEAWASGVTDATAEAGQRHADQNGPKHIVRLVETRVYVLRAGHKMPYPVT